MKTQSLDKGNTACACGSVFPIHEKGYCGGTGYAVTPDGTRICYACADKAQIEALKDRSKPFCAYVSLVSKDSWLGYKITTWTGGELMRVTSARPCTLTRQSYTHDGRGYMSIHAVDVHGGHWAGRGSEGIAIKLRPVKG